MRRRSFSLLAVVVALWAAGGLVLARSYVHAYVEYRGFAPPVLPRGVPGGRLLDMHFMSTALHRRARYFVYLPPGYAPRRHRYPVLYLLHGTPGRPQAFMRIAAVGTYLSEEIHQHRARPMLMVIPDGRIRGDNFSQTGWADTSLGSYAQFVIDVQHNVDHRFATIRRRGARVLAGYSEGAYGAINVGLRHPATFGGMEAWSGYYVVMPYGPFQNAGPFDIAANSPLDYAASLGPSFAHRPTRAFLYTGTSDLDRAQLDPMLAELRAIGIQAEGRVFHGGHDWAMWRAHTAQMIEIASRFMTPLSQRAVHQLSTTDQYLALERGRQAAAASDAAAIARATARQLKAASGVR